MIRDCAHAEELLNLRLAEPLSMEEQSALERHLATCDACTLTAADLQRLDEELKLLAVAPRESASRIADLVMTVWSREAADVPATTVERGSRAHSGWWVLLGLAAGLLIAIGAFQPWKPPKVVVQLVPVEPPTPPVPVASLAVSAGVVQCSSSGGEWRPLPVKAGVTKGERVRTPGVCEFTCPDDSRIRLDAGTEVTFVSDRKVELHSGRAIGAAAKDSKIAVRLPGESVEVEGTEFDVRRMADLAELTVLKGKLALRGVEGADSLDQNEFIRVSKGRIGERGRVHDIIAATRWVHALLILKGPEDRELADRVNRMFASLGREKLSYMRENEIRSLGFFCVEPLTECLKKNRDVDSERRIVAANILGDLAQPWSIPRLIDLLADKEPDVRMHAARGVQRLTGGELGRPPDYWRNQSVDVLKETQREWRDWWEKNRERYPTFP